MNFFADLHIHSCLSPCGDNDMTPGNILGMAVVKGLEIVAISDHNTARNLPAAEKIAEAYGLLLVPAIEITTSEEVHMLGYFPDVPTAVAFGEMLKAHLPPKKNKPAFFGEQLVMNEDDEVIDHEDARRTYRWSNARKKCGLWAACRCLRTSTAAATGCS